MQAPKDVIALRLEMFLQSYFLLGNAARLHQVDSCKLHTMVIHMFSLHAKAADGKITDGWLAPPSKKEPGDVGTD